ncbi:hypothetical protein CLOM_g1947 [Closterium sp. NIES-68]|nr:hypothetical protein CLOM_g1947 [Closterium sp. NIES-68]
MCKHLCGVCSGVWECVLCYFLFEQVFVMIDLEKIFLTQQESLQSEQERESYEDSKFMSLRYNCGGY